MDGAHQATATKVQLAGYLVKWEPWEPCCVETTLRFFYLHLSEELV